MQFDRDGWTFDCEPTMTDSEVLGFCRDGCLLLRGAVPDEINRRACDWLDGKNQIRPSYGFGMKRGYVPDWRNGNTDGYAR